MAFKIARLHGGGVGFEPRSPRGLAVVIRLPARPPRAGTATEGSGT
jgi:signal transduction histidine kinase